MRNPSNRSTPGPAQTARACLRPCRSGRAQTIGRTVRSALPSLQAISGQSIHSHLSPCRVWSIALVWGQVNLRSHACLVKLTSRPGLGRRASLQVESSHSQCWSPRSSPERSCSCAGAVARLHRGWRPPERGRSRSRRRRLCRLHRPRDRHGPAPSIAGGKTWRAALAARLSCLAARTFSPCRRRPAPASLALTKPQLPMRRYAGVLIPGCRRCRARP